MNESINIRPCQKRGWSCTQMPARAQRRGSWQDVRDGGGAAAVWGRFHSAQTRRGLEPWLSVGVHQTDEVRERGGSSEHTRQIEIRGVHITYDLSII